ncbi:lipopolysaccharide biosynthesis protein [Roseococcus sp. SYP-B2431]|uniref:oligosaccharide flippase family protein n=1 Tax=Roseococcus sp. SYP-B2431 TaxID=2496640 RepID=UPI0010387447|nr:oligosaccharide flippase family protein [Roseococcus sp. SYP-B2431]TCH96300.1 lipopolysaccharide biosynthesis protein [Roseococcus sp. SYP-B2431]
MTADRGSILRRTVRGAGWVVAWRMSTRLLGLASTLALVRLLAPGDFGLVALAAAFAVSLDVCLALGVEEQIIRAERPDRRLYDTAFTINLLRGAAVGAAVALAAAPAARFFGDARLEEVLLALALSALLSGLANIGAVEFRRELRFEREFMMQIVPRIAGIAVTIGLAAILRSHWALVGGIFVNRLGIVAMGYALHPYRPRLSLAAWRELAGISAWSWALSVASVVKDRSESLVIGRVLGPVAVGHYTVGVEVSALAATELVDPICRACMPGFAASRREGDGGGTDYLRILALLAMLTLPAGLGISLVAGPVIALGFGQAWLAAVPVVVVLGMASVLTPLGNVSAAMLNAHAKLSRLLGITATAAAMRVGLLLVLTPMLGITGAALAVAVAVVAEHLMTMLLAFRLLKLPLIRLVPVLWRPVLASAAMALLLWQTGYGWAPAPATGLAAAGELARGAGLGAGCYVAVLGLLWSLAGRPAGAEADMLGLLSRGLGRLRAGHGLQVG